MIVINVEGRQHYDDVLRAQSERPVWPPPRRCAQRSFPPQKRATLVAVPIAVDGHTPAASSPNTKEARCSRIFRVPCPLFSSRHVSIGVSRAPPFREGGGRGSGAADMLKRQPRTDTTHHKSCAGKCEKREKNLKNKRRNEKVHSETVSSSSSLPTAHHCPTKRCGLVEWRRASPHGAPPHRITPVSASTTSLGTKEKNNYKKTKKNRTRTQSRT